MKYLVLAATPSAFLLLGMAMVYCLLRHDAIRRVGMQRMRRAAPARAA